MLITARGNNRCLLGLKRLEESQIVDTKNKEDTQRNTYELDNCNLTKNPLY